jgi:methionyl-tRNA formyltransferase
MNIVFIGTVRFSLEMFISLVQSGQNIVGVVTGKDNQINADFADLNAKCHQYNIPCIVTGDVNNVEVINWIEDLSPEVIFCFGWSKLIKKELLNITPIGVVGYHPAALPQNRGRHPLIWALVLGLKKTASSFFIMDQGADSGDIISQEEIIIDAADDAGSLYETMTCVAKKQLLSLVLTLEDKTFVKQAQDHLKANVWRKRRMADGIIDWRMSAIAINNLVRGLTKPYIGAEFCFNGNQYKVWKSKIVNDVGYENIEPGKVIKVKNKLLVVKCMSGAIELQSLEPELVISEGEYL